MALRACYAMSGTELALTCDRHRRRLRDCDLRCGGRRTERAARRTTLRSFEGTERAARRATPEMFQAVVVCGFARFTTRLLYNAARGTLSRRSAGQRSSRRSLTRRRSRAWGGATRCEIKGVCPRARYKAWRSRYKVGALQLMGALQLSRADRMCHVGCHGGHVAHSRWSRGRL
eukprot:769103-Rhodomonas_salina.2